MKLKQIIFLLSILFSMQIVMAANNFTKGQRKEIQSIIHDYLLTSPEVLIEASKSLQEKQKKEMLAKIQAEIPKYKKEIFTSTTSPVIGNTKGTVYLVEFLDYACGYCRRMHKVVSKLVSSNKSVKVILKEFPIFGGSSDRAARMALAANKYGKYASFHKELLQTEPPLDDDKIDSITRKLKLDLGKMNRMADSAEITRELKNTLELAKSVGIMGTPAFIIGGGDINTPGFKSFFVPGSLTYEELNKLLNKVTK